MAALKRQRETSAVSPALAAADESIRYPNTLARTHQPGYRVRSSRAARSAARAEANKPKQVAPEPDMGDGNAIGQDLMRVQYRWPVGMPLCRPMGYGLWEVRAIFQAIVLCERSLAFQEGKILALHGFIRKSQKTPAQDLALARKRKREFEA
jgi:phage-related protein